MWYNEIEVTVALFWGYNKDQGIVPSRRVGL